MDSNEKSFRHNFETLLALFKKLAEKMSEGEIPGANPQFANQFKIMLSQYETMKHISPEDIPEQLREPFRQMMENMIKQLKDEIGEDIIQPHQEEGVRERTVTEIEKMLSQPGLDPGEIDKLLDKLTDLKSRKG
jgi:L-lactate utilization protein LutC